MDNMDTDTDFDNLFGGHRDEEDWIPARIPLGSVLIYRTGEDARGVRVGSVDLSRDNFGHLRVQVGRFSCQPHARSASFGPWQAFISRSIIQGHFARFGSDAVEDTYLRLFGWQLTVKRWKRDTKRGNP